MGFFEQLWESIRDTTPRFLLAAGILITGWIIARVVRNILFKRLAKSGLGDWASERLGVRTGGTHGHRAERIAAQTVFFALIVLTTIFALDVIHLPTLNDPLVNLVDEITGALPDVLLAAIILALAFVLAKLMSLGATKMLDAASFDERMSRLGGIAMQEERRLSKSVGALVFWFVLSVGIIQMLSSLEINGLVEPLQGALSELALMLPNMIGAGLLLVVGVVAARFVGRLAAHMLIQVGFDDLVARLGLVPESLQTSTESSEPVEPTADAKPKVNAETDTEDSEAAPDAVTDIEATDGPQEDLAMPRTPSQVAGMVVAVVLVMLVLSQVLSIVKLERLADLLDDLIDFLPQLGVSVVILAVGFWAGNWVQSRIEELYARQSEGLPRFLGAAARIGVLVFASAMAMQQLGVAPELIVTAFAILFGAVCLALSLAFGLGSREVAGEIVRKEYEKYVPPSKRPKARAAKPKTAK